MQKKYVVQNGIKRKLWWALALKKGVLRGGRSEGSPSPGWGAWEGQLIGFWKQSKDHLAGKAPTSVPTV